VGSHQDVLAVAGRGIPHPGAAGPARSGHDQRFGDVRDRPLWVWARPGSSDADCP
jgi:hypothetical protein